MYRSQIKCDKGERARFRSDVLSFQQMSKQFNQELSLTDKLPIEELRQFLEFQLPRQWTPVFSELSLGPQRRQLSRGGKLLVIVRNNRGGMVVDSHTGEVVMGLRGHRDYAFASGWHPGGHIFATGNEDKTCPVWVAVGGRHRRWKESDVLSYGPQGSSSKCNEVKQSVIKGNVLGSGVMFSRFSRCPNSSTRNYL
ncbi:hypothetical protein L6164_016022 [Bauhinia variegata]|uniref:Uncharacterized protein n=1 Tax=Bauhinia variegata TaxID=167791 RepID=A0ACB9NMF7_BAUVA|nr:hypothetical protein L6164_016022 [Bauhinia variegata]